MDRIEAMKVSIAAPDEGSLAGSGRRLGRSLAAVSRAIGFLENHVGTELLHRTTRTITLSEAGERYATACRLVLIQLGAADLSPPGEPTPPRGTLTVGTPPSSVQANRRASTHAHLHAFAPALVL